MGSIASGVFGFLQNIRPQSARYAKDAGLVAANLDAWPLYRCVPPCCNAMLHGVTEEATILEFGWTVSQEMVLQTHSREGDILGAALAYISLVPAFHLFFRGALLYHERSWFQLEMWFGVGCNAG